MLRETEYGGSPIFVSRELDIVQSSILFSFQN